MRTEHKLIGLEPDNLLAFLALLGLLRALETSKAQWKPRVRWDISNPPTRPVLIIEEPASCGEVARQAALGCAALAEDYSFDGRPDPNWSRKEARLLLEHAVALGPKRRSRADMLAALVSDGAFKDDMVVLPTPLCLLFGQGHQHFLQRFAAVPRQASAPPRGRRKAAVTPSPEQTITEALFQTWERVDQSQSFRWDPAEDRRYALRFGDPAKDAATTVHGANRLATFGLPVLTAMPETTRGRVRLSMLGASRNFSGQIQVTWPICGRTVSLSRLRALLTHRELHKDKPDRGVLRSLGIHELRRATRISVGKFFNITRAICV